MRLMRLESLYKSRDDRQAEGAKSTMRDSLSGREPVATGVILVVDDTPTNLEVLFDYLSDSGFRLLVAEDGESALETAKYALPDLILLDVLMPGIDGFETCRRLKADAATADIPVIFMTALTETLDKVKGFNLGAADYITKPFQQEEVLARVKTLLKLQDLTRQLREQVAREQAAQRRATIILESITDAFFGVDHTWRFTYLNRQAERLLQRTREELLDRVLWDEFPETLGSTFYRELHRAASEQVSVEFEEFYPPLNTWFETHAYPSAEGISVYFQAITERKQAEEALRTLSTALESAVEGISRLDAEGVYVIVNPAYARMLGYQPEELVGVNWQQTVYPDDRKNLQAAYERMRQDGRAEVEARAVRKDGTIFDKQIILVKAQSQQQFIGHFCFVKDISDRREVERLKDEFVSIVSHELRTPLTSISAALDLLASGVLQNQPEDAQHMLAIAASNTDRLVRLINDILDIERIESGKVVMTKQVCNATALMNQSVEAVQDIADLAGVTLSVSSVPVRLWADPDRLIQVFTNLLSNAIKFSPGGSTVWLTAEVGDREQGIGNSEGASGFQNLASGPYVLFCVKDHGRGIPADNLESIFERFQQVDASDSRQKGGTGLGLAICRSILQQHGGQIWVESILGAGSTFYVALPVALPADAPTDLFMATASETEIESEIPLEAESETLSQPLDLPSSPRVLICDDDASVRTVIRAMLERQGYRVLTAASGQEAIEQAIVQLPQVILLNLMMPGMNGWETLAVLKHRAETQQIPVIILSGLLPDARVPHPEASDWIVKPPDPLLLRRALERAIADQSRTIKVLIVEDDLDLAQVLATLFSRHPVETFHAQTGREAIQMSQQLVPDLLVLDLELPEQDGFAVVDWLRQHNRLCWVPLVVYTARDLNDRDRERLKLGQTLFLTKGRITPQEFEQRVIALLDRMIQGTQGDNSHDHPPHSDH